MLNYFYVVNEIEQIKGNDTAISAMLEFSRAVSNGANPRPLLLHGPPGTGKTSAARALANKEGWNIVELNASDYRDRDTIKKTLLSAATSRSLFAGKTLILLDEIDDMNKRFDSGAGSAITEVISKSMNPIIFIANDMWDQSISFLRNKTTPVQFKKLNQLTITSILSDISSKLGLNADKDMVLAISGRSNGDA
ncbi:MAG: AAA family ATPase, partial [Candidatus Marsarchaeota archaeon]|nr:AAA family ATPase [Candidatus Marsarchaeota archaeon]